MFFIIKTVSKLTLNIAGVCLLMVSTQTFADIYKTVDANGNVTFTNEASPNAQKLNLPPITIVAAPKKSAIAAAKASNPASAVSAPVSVPNSPSYSYQILFDAPKPEQVVFKVNGSIPVVMQVSPALKADVRTVLYLDGQVVATGLTTDIALAPLSAGTHWITGKVFSESGDVLGENKVSFSIFDAGNSNASKKSPQIIPPQPFISR